MLRPWNANIYKCVLRGRIEAFDYALRLVKPPAASQWHCKLLQDTAPYYGIFNIFRQGISDVKYSICLRMVFSLVVQFHGFELLIRRANHLISVRAVSIQKIGMFQCMLRTEAVMSNDGMCVNQEC